MTKENFSHDISKLKSDIENITQLLDKSQRHISKIQEEMNKNDNYLSYGALEDVYNALSEARISLPYVRCIDSLEHANRAYKE